MTNGCPLLRYGLRWLRVIDAVVSIAGPEYSETALETTPLAILLLPRILDL